MAEQLGGVGAPLYDIGGRRLHSEAMPAESADVEQAIWVAPVKARIKAIRFTPNAAISSSATDYANLQFRKNGAGSNITNKNLQSTAVTAFVRTAVSTSLDARVEAGDRVTLNLDINGTFTMPRSLYEIEWEPDYDQSAV